MRREGLQPVQGVVERLAKGQHRRLSRERGVMGKTVLQGPLFARCVWDDPSARCSVVRAPLRVSATPAAADSFGSAQVIDSSWVVRVDGIGVSGREICCCS